MTKLLCRCERGNDMTCPSVQPLNELMASLEDAGYERWAHAIDARWAASLMANCTNCGSSRRLRRDRLAQGPKHPGLLALSHLLSLDRGVGMNELLSAALGYAQRGWRVFPLHGIVALIPTSSDPSPRPSARGIDRTDSSATSSTWPPGRWSAPPETTTAGSGTASTSWLRVSVSPSTWSGPSMAGPVRGTVRPSTTERTSPLLDGGGAAMPLSSSSMQEGRDVPRERRTGTSSYRWRRSMASIASAVAGAAAGSLPSVLTPISTATPVGRRGDGRASRRPTVCSIRATSTRNSRAIFSASPRFEILSRAGDALEIVDSDIVTLAAEMEV